MPLLAAAHDSYLSTLHTNWSALDGSRDEQNKSNDTKEGAYTRRHGEDITDILCALWTIRAEISQQNTMNNELLHLLTFRLWNCTKIYHTWFFRGQIPVKVRKERPSIF